MQIFNRSRSYIVIAITSTHNLESLRRYTLLLDFCNLFAVTLTQTCTGAYVSNTIKEMILDIRIFIP